MPATIAWCLAIGAPLAVGSLCQPAQALRQGASVEAGLLTPSASGHALLRTTPGILSQAMAPVGQGMAQQGGIASSTWPDTLSAPAADPAGAFSYSLGRDTEGRGSQADLSVAAQIGEALIPASPRGGMAGAAAVQQNGDPAGNDRQGPSAGAEALLSATATSSIPRPQRSLQEQFMRSEVNDLVAAALDQSGMTRQCIDSAHYLCQDIVNGITLKPLPAMMSYRPEVIKSMKQER